MGQATIISGGAEGLYNVSIIRHAGTTAKRLAAIANRLTALGSPPAPGLIVTAITAVITKTAELATDQANLTNVQNSFLQGVSTRKELATAMAAVTSKMSELIKARRDLSLLNIEKNSITREQANIQAAVAPMASRSAWCTDLTEDLAAGVTVGTMEMNGVDDQIILTPGGAVSQSIGKLQHVGASTPSAVFWNKAILPCWQKWKPTYRIGTITAIDYETDTCDVGLLAQYSEEGGLLINQAGAVWTEAQIAISGWQQFAQDNPDNPLVTNTSDTQIPKTAQLMTDLQTVQDYVNNRYRYQLDKDQYGVLEHFAVMSAGGSGDCEDFALTKAQMLIDMGYPASAIHLEIGMTKKGIGHAWLVVQTANGDYALDINYQKVMLDGSLDYIDKQRQTGMSWAKTGVKLSDVPIEYMDDLNSDVFEVGDNVVVQFVGQDWKAPKVIGFEDHPEGGREGIVVYGYDKHTGINYLRLYRIKNAASTFLETLSLQAGDYNPVWFSWDKINNCFDILTIEDRSVYHKQIRPDGTVLANTLRLTAPTPVQWLPIAASGWRLDNGTIDILVTIHAPSAGAQKYYFKLLSQGETDWIAMPPVSTGLELSGPWLFYTKDAGVETPHVMYAYEEGIFCGIDARRCFTSWKPTLYFYDGNPLAFSSYEINPVGTFLHQHPSVPPGGEEWLPGSNLVTNMVMIDKDNILYRIWSSVFSDNIVSYELPGPPPEESWIAENPVWHYALETRLANKNSSSDYAIIESAAYTDVGGYTAEQKFPSTYAPIKELIFFTNQIGLLSAYSYPAMAKKYDVTDANIYAVQANVVEV